MIPTITHLELDETMVSAAGIFGRVVGAWIPDETWRGPRIPELWWFQIDLDPRNALLAQERCGMFLTVEEHEQPTVVDTEAI